MKSSELETPVLLSSRFEQALLYAHRLHITQIRKGYGYNKRIPYITHLLTVAALVLEDGGDEDQAIAALLHDAPEDQGGKATLEEIRNLFGRKVAEIVDSCTDAYKVPKPPWRERKEHFLERLRHASTAVARISLADKLHNARSLWIILCTDGESSWERFNGGKDGTLWYYRSLLEIFHTIIDSPMVDELAQVVEKIEALENR